MSSNLFYFLQRAKNKRLVIEALVAGLRIELRTSGLWIRRSNRLSYPAILAEKRLQRYNHFLNRPNFLQKKFLNAFKTLFSQAIQPSSQINGRDKCFTFSGSPAKPWVSSTPVVKNSPQPLDKRQKIHYLCTTTASMRHPSCQCNAGHWLAPVITTI